MVLRLSVKLGGHHAIGTTGILWLGAMGLAASAAAQTPQAPAAVLRTVVAATKLPTVSDVPLYFKAVSVTLPPGENSGVSAAHSILYQTSGSTEVSARWRGQDAEQRRGAVHHHGEDGGAQGGQRRTIDLPPLRPCPRWGLGTA